MPDGNVDVDSVRTDVHNAAEVGAGGVEFVAFFEYGGHLFKAPSAVSWSTGNFGNDNFNRLFLAALTAHNETGMIMDFALGPNQGQGIPSLPVNENLQWDLVSNNKVSHSQSS